MYDNYQRYILEQIKGVDSNVYEYLMEQQVSGTTLYEASISLFKDESSAIQHFEKIFKQIKDLFSKMSGKLGVRINDLRIKDKFSNFKDVSDFVKTNIKNIMLLIWDITKYLVSQVVKTIKSDSMNVNQVIIMTIIGMFALLLLQKFTIVGPVFTGLSASFMAIASMTGVIAPIALGIGTYAFAKIISSTQTLDAITTVAAGLVLSATLLASVYTGMLWAMAYIIPILVLILSFKEVNVKEHVGKLIKKTESEIEKEVSKLPLYNDLYNDLSDHNFDKIQLQVRKSILQLKMYLQKLKGIYNRMDAQDKIALIG